MARAVKHKAIPEKNIFNDMKINIQITAYSLKLLDLLISSTSIECLPCIISAIEYIVANGMDSIPVLKWCLIV